MDNFDGAGSETEDIREQFARLRSLKTGRSLERPHTTPAKELINNFGVVTATRIIIARRLRTRRSEAESTAARYADNI
jgi:hypothetical protein